MYKYFIVYVTEDIIDQWNMMEYYKGDKIFVRISESKEDYLTLNTIDIIPTSKAKKLYELKCVDKSEGENE